MACHTPPLKNSITQPRSHPIIKNVEDGMGPDGTEAG